MIEWYVRWFEYEIDAHDKVIRSVETVPAERRTSAEFRKAVSLLGHLVGARQVWLFRLGEWPKAPDGLFPETADLPAVVADMRDVQARWAEYLGRLTDDDLGRVFEYQSFDGGRFRNRVEDILAQLFGHSWYHRGQIAVLVKAAGGTPAVTDFVYWCREPIAPTP